jgi:pimeloyl-ACP methyl ester carboxylesterase
VIQAIRDGRITAPGGHPFAKIVYVGHSYGSWVGWYEVSQYNDQVTSPLLEQPASTLRLLSEARCCRPGRSL